jgi:hypothetical protein
MIGEIGRFARRAMRFEIGRRRACKQQAPDANRQVVDLVHEIATASASCSSATSCTALVECLPAFGERELASGAIQKPRTEMLLELGDLA